MKRFWQSWKHEIQNKSLSGASKLAVAFLWEMETSEQVELVEF